MMDVLISYRRDDDPHAVDRLFDALKGALDPYQVFLDIDNIPLGVDFEQYLRQQVSGCRVLLAIIGPRWLDIRGDGGKRRLDSPGDFVRIEIEAALDRGIPVVPVLLDNTSMPKVDQLPEALKPLVKRQNWEVTRKRFTSDVDGLAQRIKQMLADATPSMQPSAKPLALSAIELTLPDKPSIAVLPFRNLSGDPEQEYFADGIAEDIITVLSRSPSLFVIARNSSFTYKGRAVDVKQIARELGVRYVLEGSVRLGGNRVRITAQLIDAESGNHLWADRYDRDRSDIFAVQDEITEAVALAIEPTVAHMERQRAVRKPPESLGAWEAYQRGRWHKGRIGITENEAAKRFLQRAIDLDPNFAPAHAYLAYTISEGAMFYDKTSLAEASDEVFRVSQRAISLDPMDVDGHLCVSVVLFMRGDIDGMLAEVRQALAISPNYFNVHNLLGVALIYSGRRKEGIEALHRAIRLDPFIAGQRVQIAVAHYFLRDYAAAIEAAQETLRSYPDHPQPQRWLAASLAQIDRVDEAGRALEKAVALAPGSFDMFVRQRAPWMRAEDREHMREGLRKAGWKG